MSLPSKNKKPYVLAGVQLLKYTLQDGWANLGVDGQYTVMRWRDKDDLALQIKKKMRVEEEKFLGKSYDRQLFCLGNIIDK